MKNLTSVFANMLITWITEWKRYCTVVVQWLSQARVSSSTPADYNALALRRGVSRGGASALIFIVTNSSNITTPRAITQYKAKAINSSRLSLESAADVWGCNVEVTVSVKFLPRIYLSFIVRKWQFALTVISENIHSSMR